MPPATPDQVRAGLAVVTTAAAADTRAVAASAAGSPSQVRAALFAATPLIIAEYANGTAALALDWYEELRDAATPPHTFTPAPLVLVKDDDIATAVAVASKPLYDLERGVSDVPLHVAIEQSLTALEPQVQKKVAGGFRRTMVGNTNADPDAAGWKRFARGEGACKFCRMLAAKGAVYTKETARFAAHTDCNCIAGPAFGGKEIWVEATPMQYLASSRHRTPEQKAALRDYLNEHFPDAPG